MALSCTTLCLACLHHISHVQDALFIAPQVLHHGAPVGNALWEYDGWGPGYAHGGIYHEHAPDTEWVRSLRPAALATPVTQNTLACMQCRSRRTDACSYHPVGSQ